MSNLIVAMGRSDAVTHLESLGEDPSDWIVFTPEKDSHGKGHHLDRWTDRVIFLANPERNEWAANMQAVIASIGGPVVRPDGKIFEGGTLVGEISYAFNVPETRWAVRELGFTWRKKSLVFGIAVADCECGHDYEREHDHLDLNLACQVDGCECEAYSP